MNDDSRAKILGMSLLHVSKAQAAAVAKLNEASLHGLLVQAGWQRRLPVLVDIMPAGSPLIVGQSNEAADRLHLGHSLSSTLEFQKLIKAFGTRIASRARKPLKFERVKAGGHIHLAPAKHYLAACGMQLEAGAIQMAATCPSCILLALTPLPIDVDSEYHPCGRVYVSDVELQKLRDYACRGVLAAPIAQDAVSKN